MADTDPFNATELLALTAIGESENLGASGMTQTICVVLNRQKANLKWMGGNDVRQICIQPDQFQCWNPGNDRDRIISIGLSNPTYGPYLTALGIAADALAGTLRDTVQNAVSYIDGAPSEFLSRKGRKPFLICAKRYFYDLASVS